MRWDFLAEAGDKKQHQLLPVGFLFVVLLAMLLLIEDVGVVNGNVNQVPREDQHGKLCAAARESGGYKKTDGELLRIQSNIGTETREARTAISAALAHAMRLSVALCVTCSNLTVAAC